MSLRIATRAARPALRLAPTVVAAPSAARFAHFTAPARPVISSFSSNRPIAATMATAAAPAAQIKAGDAFPSVPVRTQDTQTTIDLSTLKGKNVIVTVPGAFTATCHAQIPGYISAYDKFKAKGVNDIYVVSVNDIFVVNAWKESLSGNKETVKFAGDDQGKLAQALGLVLDATGGLGSKRLIRSALIVEDGKVVNAIVEPVSGKTTITHADEVLKAL